MPTSVTVKVDFENNAETWWDAMRADLPRLQESDPEVAELLSRLGGDEHSVEIVDANTIQRFCATVEAYPGWEDGPEYARNPLILEGE
jgi:hypothetical protein